MSPIRPVDARQNRGGRALQPGRGVLPALHLISGTATREACHAAILGAASLLEELFGISMLLAAEAAELGHGPVMVWRSADNFANADIAAWLTRARAGHALAFRHEAAGVVAAGGPERDAPNILLIADCLLLPPELEIAMRDVAEFSARHLYRLNREEEMRRRLGADRGAAQDAMLLRAHADLAWEAGADGILHVTEIFRDRRDLARKLEGLKLADLAPGLSNLERPLRAKPITLDGELAPLFLTACPDPAGKFPLRGVVAQLETQLETEPAVAALMLAGVVAARQREEQLRSEAEGMLLGLRVLLSDAPFREKLRQLARQLTSAIGCDEARLILVRPGDMPRLVMPDDETLGPRALAIIERLEDSAAMRLLTDGDGDVRRLRALLRLPPGDILAINLPASGEHYHLLCRARRGLTQSDYGVTERISLLLRQALLIQEDQKQMIHAAKLSALGQMSTGIAHELRQPLNAMSIAVQNIDLLVEMDKLSPITLKEKTGKILAQIDRASKIMDRMRRFGRKTAGDYKPVGLAAMARSARSLMDAVIAGAGIQFEIAVPDDLTVMAEELEIEQVLVNLIQNAADALSDRRGGGHIRFWSCDDPEDAALVRLNAEDNGPGFPPEVRKHALDAFFTTKPEGKGTGLGLSIAHSILREHGGRILIGEGPMGGGMVSLVLKRPQARLIPFAARPSQAVPS